MKNVDNFKELDQNDPPEVKPMVNIGDHDKLNPDMLTEPIEPESLSREEKELINRVGDDETEGTSKETDD